MNQTSLAVAIVICVAALVALGMVLNHLATMRVTSGEVASFRTMVLSHAASLDTSQAGLAKRLDDLEQRLQHIDTRTKR